MKQDDELFIKVVCILAITCVTLLIYTVLTLDTYNAVHSAIER